MDEYATDQGRLVHSGSFRRLQGKTQILNLCESDFYRTRLTHTLEVAHIAGNLAKQLGKNNPDHPSKEHLPMADLIQAIALTHDLGHPPFGHGGEVALNCCMRTKAASRATGKPSASLQNSKSSRRTGART